MIWKADCLAIVTGRGGDSAKRDCRDSTLSKWHYRSLSERSLSFILHTHTHTHGCAGDFLPTTLRPAASIAAEKEALKLKQ